MINKSDFGHIIAINERYLHSLKGKQSFKSNADKTVNSYFGFSCSKDLMIKILYYD